MSTNKKEYDRKYHANRSPEAKLKKYELQEKRRKENLELVQNYKSSIGCCKCGEKDYICLDFHHITNDKELTIGDGGTRGWSIKRIFSEIDKCIVMCSNCHRKLHRDKNQAVAQR